MSECGEIMILTLLIILFVIMVGILIYVYATRIRFCKKQKNLIDVDNSTPVSKMRVEEPKQKSMKDLKGKPPKINIDFNPVRKDLRDS